MRVRLSECLLAIGAILVAILGAEALFSLLGLRYLPLRLHGDLPEEVRVFAQSSKAGVVPRDPVLLLGDSYAQGYGDWLLDADPDRNGPFHSAHIIQSRSGRDVISLGVSGAGSAEGMVLFPAVAYAHSKQSWYLRLPPPHVAVVYFFEGNDLNDNLTFLKRRVENSGAVDQVDRAIAGYAAAEPASVDWWRHFPLLQLSGRLVQRILAGRWPSEVAPQPTPDDAARANAADPPNVVEVSGRSVELPSNLQSPAIELTRPELERAVVVYARSLAALRKLLPGTPVLVAYLPSPLSSYRLIGTEVSIQRYGADGLSRYPAERVAVYSDAICSLIRAATVEQGAGFLDLRTAIRAASVHAILHGPRDFKHFNRAGMEVLGRAVAARVNQPLTQEFCSQSAS